MPVANPYDIYVMLKKKWKIMDWLIDISISMILICGKRRKHNKQTDEQIQVGGSKVNGRMHVI